MTWPPYLIREAHELRRADFNNTEIAALLRVPVASVQRLLGDEPW